MPFWVGKPVPGRVRAAGPATNRLCSILRFLMRYTWWTISLPSLGSH